MVIVYGPVETGHYLEVLYESQWVWWGVKRDEQIEYYLHFDLIREPLQIDLVDMELIT